MLKLDPDDQDDEENKVLTALSSTSTAAGPNTAISSVANASILSEADKLALSTYKVLFCFFFLIYAGRNK